MKKLITFLFIFLLSFSFFAKLKNELKKDVVENIRYKNLDSEYFGNKRKFYKKYCKKNIKNLSIKYSCNLLNFKKNKNVNLFLNQIPNENLAQVLLINEALSDYITSLFQLTLKGNKVALTKLLQIDGDGFIGDAMNSIKVEIFNHPKITIKNWNIINSLFHPDDMWRTTIYENLDNIIQKTKVTCNSQKLKCEKLLKFLKSEKINICKNLSPKIILFMKKHDLKWKKICNTHN